MWKIYKNHSQVQGDSEKNERSLVRNLFCIVLSHYVFTVKGGWQLLEETVNFILVHSDEVRRINI